MRTIIRFLAVLMGLFMIFGCEDERIYPSPQKYIQPEIITVAVPFNAEFTTNFTKSFVDSLHLTDYGFDVWLNLWARSIEMKDPFYFLEQTGAGTTAELGNFTIKMDSWWSSLDGTGFTTAEITTNGGVLYVNIENSYSSFTNEFPYDQKNWGPLFSVAGGLGKYHSCTGGGNVAISLSQTASNVMIHKWTGELILVKRK